MAEPTGFGNGTSPNKLVDNCFSHTEKCLAVFIGTTLGMRPGRFLVKERYSTHLKMDVLVTHQKNFFLHSNRVERIFVCYFLSFFLDSREIDFSGLAGTRGSIGRSDKRCHQRAFPPPSRIGFPPLRPCDCTACLTPTMLHNPFALFFLSFPFFCVSFNGLLREQKPDGLFDYFSN